MLTKKMTSRFNLGWKTPFGLRVKGRSSEVNISTSFLVENSAVTMTYETFPSP